jgi:hypothetical protein
MASQVLSGASNPTYTNNTGQNVRVVINYMSGTDLVPATPAQRAGVTARGTGGTLIPAKPAVPSRLTINWAGVSVTNSSSVEIIVIGRNLAFGNLYTETATGGTKTVFISGPNEAQDAATPFRTVGFTEVATDVALTSSLSGNNAKGVNIALPTELMLAPNQTFSAVCGVHNIVIIPENG